MKINKIKEKITSKVGVAAITGVICFSLGAATNTPETSEVKETQQTSAEVEVQEDIAVKEDVAIEEVVQLEEVELSAGKYIAGEDFTEGKYNVIALSGGGNVMSVSQINAIMGKDMGSDRYIEEYKNATFKRGTELEITQNLTIKLVPVNK